MHLLPKPSLLRASLRKRRLSLLLYLRRIPIPALSILIGLACGALVWVVLDQVQPRALRDIFAEELQGRLEQQARETLIRFENFVAAHTATTRLLANHRNLSDYLEPIYWFNGDSKPPVAYFQNPPWLPDTSLWQSLIRPSHILLMDKSGRTREIYTIGKEPLPAELMQLDELFLSESRVQAYLTTLQDLPYLLIAEEAEDATGTSMGYLMLVVPIDSEFLTASQQGIPGSGVVVALIDADQQRILSSSNPASVANGSLLDARAQEYLITAQSFFEYSGTDTNMQFATLVTRHSVEATRLRVATIERRQRIVAAVTFVSVFTLVFYLLSARLSRTLRRISLFSRRALGGKQLVLERGNQIFVLEDWIRQFIRQVLAAREEMRREHESEMKESEALKQAIMETALDSIITIDESGLIVEFNATAERIFGYRRDEVIGRDLRTLIIEPRWHQAFRQMQGLFCQDQAGGIQDARLEMEALHMDGTAFPVEVSIKRISLKQRLVLTVYIHDISNRKRAEQEIASLARFPAESPSPVLRVNHLGVILYANPASAPLLDYWGCEQGQTLPLFWRRQVQGVFDTGQDWETEIDCGSNTYSLLLTPVSDLDYLNIFARDITAIRSAELRAREHQQELVHVCRLSTMGEMATGLAHELNQPLAAIANFANGCVRRLHPDAQGADDLTYALGQINSQADRAGEIIRRLRRLVGKQLPVRGSADMNELVREVCSFVEFEARKAQVQIEQQLSISELGVWVDVVQIEQVLLNLIRNALDALLEVPAEQRQLRVRSYRDDAGEICVEVEDSGPGIAKDAVAHLFEPFFTTKQSGMGMGLVISQTIVEDHHGRIEVRPLAEGGSLFIMILPEVQEKEQREAG